MHSAHTETEREMKKKNKKKRRIRQNDMWKEKERKRTDDVMRFNFQESHMKYKITSECQCVFALIEFKSCMNLVFASNCFFETNKLQRFECQMNEHVPHPRNSYLKKGCY